MSVFHHLYPGKKHSTGHEVYKATVDAGVYAAASYGFGYVQGRYREKASLFGIPADLFAGVVLSGGALVAGDLLGYIPEGINPIVAAVGHAGLGAWAHTHGAGAGAEKSGVRRLLIQEKDVAKAKAALPDAQFLGDIPKAGPGDFLSARELANLAR